MTNSLSMLPTGSLDLPYQLSTSSEFVDAVSKVLNLAKQDGIAEVAPTARVYPQGGCLYVDNGFRQWRVNSCLLDSESHANDLFVAYSEQANLSNLVAKTVLYVSQQTKGEAQDLLLDLSSEAESYTLAQLQATPTQGVQALQHFGYLLGLLLLDFAFDDATLLARTFLNATKADVSRETWPMVDTDFAPLVKPEQSGNATNVRRFLTMDKQKLGLYPVVDSVEWVERLLKQGVKTLQLRIKNSEQGDLEQQIEQAIALGHQHNAQLFINDYWQLAIKHGAYGVHLGQEDLAIANLDAIADAGIRLGLSTHGYYELLRAKQLSPSYIALGHIFPTTTKQMPSMPQGLQRLSRYQRLVNSFAYVNYGVGGYPTVAIGGINLDNASEVLKCGVSTVAVVRAVTQSPNLTQTLLDFQTLLRQV